jgi:hypothetical protein
VAASKVLHQRVATDDHAGRVVAFESPHRTEPGFEPAVVAFDTAVCVLLGVVERGGDHSFDRSPQRGRPVGHDFDRLAMRAECRIEEASCGPEIASGETGTSMSSPC